MLNPPPKPADICGGGAIGESCFSVFGFGFFGSAALKLPNTT